MKTLSRTILAVLLIMLMMLTSAHCAIFQQVSIQPIANWDMSTFYQAPPVGQQLFGNVPFTIAQDGANVFFTQDLGMGIGNPVVGAINVQAEHVAKAHILIAGTDVREVFQGRQMGSIVFTYSDLSTAIYSLTVGDNIRDWVAVPERVVSTTSSDISTVWTGVSQEGWGYRESVIDMLSIDLSNSSTLISIAIYDDSYHLLGDAGPGLYILGVTLESVPEPSSIIALAGGLAALVGIKRRKA